MKSTISWTSTVGRSRKSLRGLSPARAVIILKYSERDIVTDYFLESAYERLNVIGGKTRRRITLGDFAFILRAIISSFSFLFSLLSRLIKSTSRFLKLVSSTTVVPLNNVRTHRCLAPLSRQQKLLASYPVNRKPPSSLLSFHPHPFSKS